MQNRNAFSHSSRDRLIHHHYRRLGKLQAILDLTIDSITRTCAGVTQHRESHAGSELIGSLAHQFAVDGE